MDPRVGVTSVVRSVNISFGRHPTSEEELLSSPELRNYESWNSSHQTASEFIDECVPSAPRSPQGETLYRQLIRHIKII